MKHQPASIEWMEAHSPLLTVCEVIREVWRNIHAGIEDDDVYDLREKLSLAVGMAKDLSKEISALKGSDEWMADFWDDNPNYGGVK